MRALLEGVAAGLGIAVPVGPIAILLVDLATRREFARAVPAALGTASADLTYAAVAAVLGQVAADAVRPLETPLRVGSAVVLLTIAGARTRRLARARPNASSQPNGGRVERGGAPTYLAFLGLTLLNPVTVAYFAALVIGLGAGGLHDAGAKISFVAGAFAASAACQLVLVGAGGVLHDRLPAKAALVTGLVGNAVIVLLAIRLLLAG